MSPGSGAPTAAGRGLAGRVALVTGASSGIGAATAVALAAEDAVVIGADLDIPGDADDGQRGSDRRPIRRVRLDVTRETDWEQALHEVLEQEGGLDIVVHSAGVSAASALTDTSLDDWRQVMATNLDGTFLALKHGVRAMADAGGSIVLLGSASGIRPSAGAAAYSTSKAAVSMLARAAAKECRANGVPVRINVVSPAGVKTAMWESMPFFQALAQEHGSVELAFAAMAEQGGGRFAEPEEVAATILFLCSDAARNITGIQLPLDDGYTL
jgi:NAD(P)-dependent dehydrogenase (short-subunit alcohol dehydrogenase family)